MHGRGTDGGSPFGGRRQRRSGDRGLEAVAGVGTPAEPVPATGVDVLGRNDDHCPTHYRGQERITGAATDLDQGRREARQNVFLAGGSEDSAGSGDGDGHDGVLPAGFASTCVLEVT